MSNDVKVWLVREYVRDGEDPRRENLRDCFVLAASASEAVAIVGEEPDLRRIHEIREACEISQLPGNRYEIVRKQ